MVVLLGYVAAAVTGFVVSWVALMLNSTLNGVNFAVTGVGFVFLAALRGTVMVVGETVERVVVPVRNWGLFMVGLFLTVAAVAEFPDLVGSFLWAVAGSLTVGVMIGRFLAGGWKASPTDPLDGLKRKFDAQEREYLHLAD